jgi:hypothetical protein
MITLSHFAAANHFLLRTRRLPLSPANPRHIGNLKIPLYLCTMKILRPTFLSSFMGLSNPNSMGAGR